MKSKGRGDIFSMVEENLPPECRIAIGMSDPRIIQELTEVERFADLLIVSGAEIESDAGFEIMISDEPERELVDLLMRGEVDGAVRGTLPASKTLLYLRKVSGIDNLARVALLKPKDADPFLFAPVGIDEGDGFDARLRLIENGIWMLESLGLDVRVGILSGGRIGDMGRSPRVDESLREGDLLIGAVADMGYQAVHHEILIEDAVRDSNLIIAPDGISGNLIFRTLTFLGEGVAWGAAVHYDLGKVFVDTSRAGGSYSGAVKLAAALSTIIGGS